MNCPNCGGTLTCKTYQHVTKLAGFTVNDSTGMVLRCVDCEAPLISSAELARYDRNAALEILASAKRPVSGDVLKFARKALGLRQKDLARLLDTNEQQISRWEKEAELDRRLRLAVASLLSIALGGGQVEQVASTPGRTLEIRKAG